MQALDLFAGTGWGVACQWLGIKEFGVEIMPEAVATREANGMETVFRDVWDGLEGRAEVPSHDLQIASPPCQTYSMAGGGAGRKALDEVIEAIEIHAYKDVALLREFGQKHDDRTSLVLAPLAYAWEYRPRFIAWEQVPTVLPVWEACAEILRGLGYSVKTAILNAEQYGVPQTRRRAVLVARLDGEVQLPTPTHSRYYPRDKTRLDPGVLKWVSMAEALGWTDDNTTFTQNNKLAHQAIRRMDQPAPTITAGHDSGNRGFLANGKFSIATPEDVAALQSYPKMLRSNYGTGGDASNRGERLVSEPAATLTSKADRSKWDGNRGMAVEEAAALQSYPTLRPELAAWKWIDAPATTVAGDPRITAREHHYHGEQNATSLRLTKDEASTLQTFERPFIWCGAKTKQFLQIGNAVPPVLAAAILSALIEPQQTKPPARRRRTLI